MRLNDLLIEKLRPVWHLLYWGAGFFILLKIFTGSDDANKIDHIYTAFFMTPIILAVYLNLYLLIPTLLKKERIIQYIISFVLLSLTSAWFIFSLFDRWIDKLLTNYYFISYEEYGTLVLYTTSFLGLATLFKLSREWMVLMRKEKELKTVQLKNLQSQVNPHFLLNSLQTIYSLSLNRSDKTPKTILRLSEILKFSIYETGDERVPLRRELEVMKDYIEMYRLRIEEDRAEINFLVDGKAGDQKILPLLFLPFIENSIKHGLQGNEEAAFVDIHFLLSENNLKFIIRNNAGQADPFVNDKYKGIGIENTRRRLKLAYPDRHYLEINNTEQYFEVMLTLTLDE